MPTYLVGPGQNYATINAAALAIPNNPVGLHEIVVSPGVYNERVLIPSKGTTTTGRIILRPADGYEARGIFDSSNSVIIRPTSDGNPLRIEHRRVTVQDIQVTRAGTSTAFPIVSIGPLTIDLIFENCLFKAHSDVISIIGDTGRKFYKCIVWNISGNSTRPAFLDQGGSPTYVNCGSYGFRAGYVTASDVFGATCRNCWAAQGGNATFVNGFSLVAGISSNNASSDSTAPGPDSFTNVSEAQFGFVDASNGNFHITENSILYDSGLDVSSVFLDDFDLETIAIWCIGPDCFSVADPPTPTTSSSPWINQNEPHEKVDDAELKPNPTKSGESSQPRGPASKVRDAKAPSLKKQSPESSQGLSAGINAQDARPQTRTIKKGYKDGFLTIMPENGGYLATPTYGTGNRLPILWESLGYGMEFADLNTVVPSRQSRTRVALDYNPSGEIFFPTRTNDSIALFQSHFQKRIGTTPATGTTYYEFAANRDGISMSGSSFGTGSYNSSGNYSAFTVAAYKRIGSSAYRFAHGLCDKIRFSFAANDEAYTRASMVFNNGTIVPNSAVYPLGSYSTLAPFPSQSISVDFLGLPIVGFEIESSNNIKTFKNVTSGSSVHRFGGYQVNGRAIVDLEKTSLAHVGSMLGGSAFSSSATLYNNERNRMILQMPDCRIKPFEMALNSNTLSMPFACYESEDGGTAPLTIKLWTTGYSATSFQPN